LTLSEEVGRARGAGTSAHLGDIAEAVGGAADSEVGLELSGADTAGADSLVAASGQEVAGAVAGRVAGAVRAGGRHSRKNRGTVPNHLAVRSSAGVAVIEATDQAGWVATRRRFVVNTHTRSGALGIVVAIPFAPAQWRVWSDAPAPTEWGIFTKQGAEALCGRSARIRGRHGAGVGDAVAGVRNIAAIDGGAADVTAGLLGIGGAGVARAPATAGPSAVIIDVARTSGGAADMGVGLELVGGAVGVAGDTFVSLVAGTAGVTADGVWCMEGVGGASNLGTITVLWDVADASLGTALSGGGGKDVSGAGSRAAAAELSGIAITSRAAAFVGVIKESIGRAASRGTGAVLRGITNTDRIAARRDVREGVGRAIRASVASLGHVAGASGGTADGTVGEVARCASAHTPTTRGANGYLTAAQGELVGAVAVVCAGASIHVLAPIGGPCAGIGTVAWVTVRRAANGSRCHVDVGGTGIRGPSAQLGDATSSGVTGKPPVGRRGAADMGAGVERVRRAVREVTAADLRSIAIPGGMAADNVGGLEVVGWAVDKLAGAALRDIAGTRGGAADMAGAVDRVAWAEDAAAVADFLDVADVGNAAADVASGLDDIGRAVVAVAITYFFGVAGASVGAANKALGLTRAGSGSRHQADSTGTSITVIEATDQAGWVATRRRLVVNTHTRSGALGIVVAIPFAVAQWRVWSDAPAPTRRGILTN